MKAGNKQIYIGARGTLGPPPGHLFYKTWDLEIHHISLLCFKKTISCCPPPAEGGGRHRHARVLRAGAQVMRAELQLLLPSEESKHGHIKNACQAHTGPDQNAPPPLLTLPPMHNRPPPPPHTTVAIGARANAAAPGCNQRAPCRWLPATPPAAAEGGEGCGESSSAASTGCPGAARCCRMGGREMVRLGVP
jgi:hypothetical protein